MMLGNLSWGVYALIASMSWGLVYVLEEKLLKTGLSPIALQLFVGLVSLPLYVVLFFLAKDKKANIGMVYEDPGLLFPIAIAGTLIVIANLLILFAVKDKNATLVSFLEITYPIFTFIFAVWILGDTQLSIPTFVGACLIACGTGIILLKG